MGLTKHTEMRCVNAHLLQWEHDDIAWGEVILGAALKRLNYWFDLVVLSPHQFQQIARLKSQGKYSHISQAYVRLLSPSSHEPVMTM
jgi:hypothetical protein